MGTITCGSKPRTFTPPGSNQVWPTLQQVCDFLTDYLVCIYGDTIVAIPADEGFLLDQWKGEIKGTKLDVL